MPSTALAVAEQYRDVVTAVVIDEVDRRDGPAIECGGMTGQGARTPIQSDTDKVTPGRYIVDLCHA